MVDPIRHKTQPIFPRMFMVSPISWVAQTLLTMTESAPSGVTKVAGANPKAMKLKASPSPTDQNNHI